MANPTFSATKAFSEAQRLHSTGRLDESETLYRQILAREPTFVPALHYMGVLAHQRGRQREALELVRQALAHSPDEPGILVNLAEIERAAGELAQAELHARLAVELGGELPAAHANLAAVLSAREQWREAAECVRQQLALDPKNKSAGEMLTRLEQRSAAGAKAPTTAERHAAAREQQALAQELSTRKRREAARRVLQRVIELDPTWAQPHVDLGVIIHDVDDDLDAAIACYDRALALEPTFAQAWCNRGIALHQAMRLEESLESFSQALRHAPDHTLVHWNRALVLLQEGRWLEGWPEFEWRWKLKDRQPIPHERWQGEPLDGRTLLLFPEQGLGDSLQMLRYLPLVGERWGAGREGRVLFSCPPEFRRLLAAGLPNVEILFDPSELPAIDLVCPVFSLPYVLGTQPATVPPPIRLSVADMPDSQPAQTIRAAEGFKVGIVWAGRPTHPDDRRRSAKLSALAPLLDVPGTRFFALQKGPAEAELAAPELAGRITPLGPQFADLADTARALDELDLLIAVDTSVAHLAGCLGKPTWLLVAHCCDWRWLRAGDDTAWYPTMRVFRQRKRNAWGELAERLRQALAVEVRAHAAARQRL